MMMKKVLNTFQNEVLRRKSGPKKTGMEKIIREGLWFVLFTCVMTSLKQVSSDELGRVIGTEKTVRYLAGKLIKLACVNGFCWS
jgi:hypothetical protein